MNKLITDAICSKTLLGNRFEILNRQEKINEAISFLDICNPLKYNCFSINNGIIEYGYIIGEKASVNQCTGLNNIAIGVSALTVP